MTKSSLRIKVNGNEVYKQTISVETGHHAQIKTKVGSLPTDPSTQIVNAIVQNIITKSDQTESVNLYNLKIDLIREKAKQGAKFSAVTLPEELKGRVNTLFHSVHQIDSNVPPSAIAFGAWGWIHHFIHLEFHHDILHSKEANNPYGPWIAQDHNKPVINDMRNYFAANFKPGSKV